MATAKTMTRTLMKILSSIGRGPRRVHCRRGMAQWQGWICRWPWKAYLSFSPLQEKMAAKN